MAKRLRKLTPSRLMRPGWLPLAGAALALLAATIWWRAPQSGAPDKAAIDAAEARAPAAKRTAREAGHIAPVTAPAGPANDPAPLWRPMAEASLGALPPYGEGWSKKGRALVRMSADLAATGALREGDRLTLSVPQLGEVRSSAVEEVSHGAGARSLLGRAAWGDGRPRRWVVTVGPDSLFAWIDTPVGPHELAIRGRYGWLLPSVNKKAGLDFSKPDYFIMDANGRWVRP